MVVTTTGKRESITIIMGAEHHIQKQHIADHIKTQNPKQSTSQGLVINIIGKIVDISKAAFQYL